jgi:hypothetical protein
MGVKLTGIVPPGNIGSLKIERQKSFHGEMKRQKSQLISGLSLCHAVQELHMTTAAMEGISLCILELSTIGSNGLSLIAPGEDESMGNEGEVVGISHINNRGICGVGTFAQSQIPPHLLPQQGHNANRTADLRRGNGQSSQGEIPEEMSFLSHG